MSRTSLFFSARSLLATSLVALFSVGLGASNASATANASAHNSGDRLIVVFDRGTSAASEARIVDRVGADEVSDLPSLNATVVDVGTSADRAATERRLEALDGVRYAEPDYAVHALSTPSDPMFPQLWGMTKIEAPAAWDRYAGGSVTVAVTDTGIDVNQRDLSSNLWVNSREIPANGIDDDGNGIVDDVNGVNFSDGNNSGDPADGHGHGTHVSGTIAASANNGYGVAGVNPQAKIMGLKFLSDSGSGSTSDAIRTIDYARQMGAKVISASWGGGGYSAALKTSIEDAGKAGMLFVAAAGNSSSDNDASPAYPASYDVDSIISVAASDGIDQIASFSNYGCTTVDLAAPGVGILSTLPNGRFVFWSGTSMATPHVSGVASLIAAREPSLGYKAIKARLLASVDPVAGMSETSVTGGRLNARKALESSASVSPAAPCEAPPAPPEPPEELSSPIISGTPTVSQTLTASAGTWSGEPSSFQYQWWICSSTDPNTCSQIGGEDTATYTASVDDIGSYLAVSVTATNDVGRSTAASELTGPIQQRPAPVLRLTGKTLTDVKKSHKVGFKIRCGESPCSTDLRVEVVGKRKSKKARTARIMRRSLTKQVALTDQVVALTLDRKARKDLSRELKRRSVVTLVITAVATGETGSTSGTVRKEIRIRR